MYIGFDHNLRELNYLRDVPDPMTPDDLLDQVAVLSRRQLARIVLVAVECGGRFQRDAVQHDPLAWMFAPRSIFGGASPVDAVTELENCERAIILHGLGMLDGDIEFIDDLRAVDEDHLVLEPEGQDPQTIDSTS